MKQQNGQKYTEDDRTQILQCLDSMGIRLPPRTKLPVEKLEKKLRSALDSAQRFSKLLSNHYFDPTTYRKWNSREKGPVLKSTSRENISEIMLNLHQGFTGAEDTRLFNNVFFDIRQTTLSFARTFDNGLRVGMLQDESGKSTIVFRVSAFHSKVTLRHTLMCLHRLLTSSILKKKRLSLLSCTRAYPKMPNSQIHLITSKHF